MKWSELRTPEVRVVYPDTVAGVARRTLFYIGAVRPDISYGFTRGPMRIPFVLHPENFRSNGLVMYLPKRVEFLTTPAVDSYAMPWVKQLVAHEYRHAVQYNNLDRGVIRVLSRLLGQQGSTVGLLCMPFWAMEGDAVMIETAMSSFGRGLQPSFSMGYRAMQRVGRDRKDRRYRTNVDKWFCGSYRDYIPDHYQLGYQLCSYAYDRYGDRVWDKVVRFGARNPYLFATTRIALEKYYGTNVSKLFRATFDDLQCYWDALPATGDSARTLTELPEGNHTTYAWPQPAGDSTVVALKTDYDRPSRLVMIDRRTGEERTAAYVGQVSTRPAVDGGRIWWTEYRRSKLFDERVYSQLCYMDFADERPRAVTGVRQALYPAAGGGGLGWVEYDPDGRYALMVGKPGTADCRRYPIPDDKEIHGLAWDDASRGWYVLATDDSGMWIGRVDAEGLHPVTQGAYITLSNLRAAGGRLYFGSIASGKDEAHCYDLAEGREYRLTESTYGSFAPAPAGEGVLVTTYDRRGYRVAEQPATEGTTVVPATLPVNLVNPPRRRWEVVNLDTVRFAAADSAAQAQTFRAKRYRKGTHLLHVHSWMPVSFDPFEAIDEHRIDLNLGVTLLSQNLLSNTEAYLSYGWNHNEGSFVKLGTRYFGLGVHLDFEAEYGGNQLFYALRSFDPQTREPVFQPRPAPDKHYSVGLAATLPLYLQHGYHTRQFSLSAAWNYSNGMVAELDRIEWAGEAIANIGEIGFRKGLHKLSFGAQWSDQVQMAHRDFAPRWGYVARAGYTFNPSNDDFSDLLSFYGRLYLPGFAQHHSFSVAGHYQTSLGGHAFPSGDIPLAYKSSQLLPRGFSTVDILPNDYTAAQINYQFPLCYPEGGIESVLYFKRIRLNIGADYARFRHPAGRGMAWRNIWSVGGGLVFDINAFRQPASATSTFTLSLFRPSTGGMWVSAALGLPF